ncbi:MAG TPA: DUF3617 domain-containing protein [Stellaceae bacterium]
MRVVFIGICLGAGPLVPAIAADDTPLNVKPGLWEMTSEGASSGAPPIPAEALARMSPEQRAQLEAAMKEAMSKQQQRRVAKKCVTQKDIARGFADMDKMGQGCTRTVKSSSSTLQEGSVQCSGPTQASGTYRFEARSPESVVATWDMTMSDGSHTMKMKNNIQGKWLGSDCKAGSDD